MNAPKVPRPTPEQKVLINWFINEEKAKGRRIRTEKAALRTMQKTQGSATVQRIQHQLPAVWCRWISGNTPVLSAKGRGKEAFARVARRLCGMGTQRSGIKTAGEGVTQ
jgi:hypothetical protein